ncbi:MFS transporter [Phytoactinopolyspora mesophila]|uniref:MFS transporter n=1 Tax=Phytoactinopolyspora mesophila TaxID=2650750 RepID=A0A7K3M9W6_9ACTN|nr:MFS transporter [Phytoactinopolyspora mesophila]NDL60056.1 MFS transporter [Phytoactinopolyspora mesophila]
MANTSISRAGPKEWVGLAVLTLPALLAAMDLSVLFMAVPWMSADLEPTATQQLWIMDIYGFFMSGLLLTMGTLGDRIGRRRLLMIGAVAFGAASVMAAYSTSAEMLIVARALLGLGGATLAPSTLALIRNMFLDADQRRTAIGVWTGAFSAGFPLGSIFGGMLVEHFWWGSVFLVNLPVMALLLVLAPLLLPEFKEPGPSRFDLVSVALSVSAVLAMIWGLKKLAADGWDPWAAGAIVAGLGIGYMFVRRQRTLAEPLIDVRLFGHRAFSASIGANMMLVLASAGVGMLAVQYLQLILGYRPFTAALWMLPLVGLLIAGVAIGTAIVRWIRPGYVVGTGLAVAGAGFALLTQLDLDDGVASLLLGYGTLNFGMGLALPLAINLVVATAPPENAGTAAAMNETGSEFGGALGIATLGSIAGAVYTSRISDTMPSAVPESVAQAAQGTLGAAFAAAEHLPPDLAAEVSRGAGDAFVRGFNVTAGVGAAALAVTAVVVTILLRRARLGDPDEAESVHR